MKRRLLIFALFVALLTTGIPLKAALVNLATAQNIAVNFFKVTAKNTSGHTALTATLKYTKTETDGTIDFYVFDLSPAKGFVIVSADDQLTPVIAYSLESNFAADNNKHGVTDWMNQAGTHIYKAIQRHPVANAQITAQWAAYTQGVKPAGAKSLGVAPLLTTKWDQEPYYNQLCPYNTADQQRTLTGCVATAMAQIMKYWNYPEKGTGYYGYMDAPPSFFYNYGNQSANFGATTYNWANMPDTLNSNNLSVATLMYHCGVAVAMNYGDDNQGGSGAYVLNIETNSWRPTAQKAYSNYFLYNANTITGVRMADYSAADWIALMKKELNAGRPIQYEGSDPNDGGHTWVCDGYDENNFLHMNWGWGGLDNGYYSVSSLSADGYNFSTAQAALIGIQPLTGLAVTATATNTNICPGANTTLSAQGNANVNYTWTPEKGLSCASCAVTAASPDTTTTYTVTIDSAGFTASSKVTVVVSSRILVSGMQTANVTCYGNANGGAKVLVSGGTPAYTYLWSNGGVRASVPDLVAGNYMVTITDALGCSISAAATITQPDSLVAAVTVANATCSLNDASLTVGAKGGTPGYIYSWNTGENDISVSALQAGNYTVTITDALGCSTQSSTIIAQPEPIHVSIASFNTTCSLLYGTATVNVTGGHQNFSFSWNTGDNTPNITNLSAGTYSVTATDILGCSSSASVSFTQPDTMNVSITTSNLTDNKVYGKAVAKVTGGAPQYSFFWNTGDTTESIALATPGVYAVTITDSRGCIQTNATQVTETTGISSLTDGLTFGVYPNPANNQVTVQLNNMGNEETSVELRNVLGQTIISGTLSDMKSQFDLSGLADGIYLVVLTRGTQSVTKQLVVKR